MNKKISIITLGLTVSSMLFIFVAMIINIPKDNINDIKGNKKEMENINILYQERDSIFNTKEVKMSNNNIKVKRNAKEWPTIKDLNETIINNREIFERGYYIISAYYDRNDIGYINYIGQYPDNYGNEQFEFKILNKNLKSKKIEEFERKISFKGTKNSDNSNIVSIATKYNNEAYLGVLHREEINKKLSKNSNEYLKENNLTFNIYKLDLDNKELEKIDEFKISKKAELNQGTPFINDNKIYFRIEENLNTQTKVNLVYYDLRENKFDKVEDELILKRVVEGDSQTYSVNDDKLNILTHKENENIFYISTLDLKTGKVINKDKEYKIDKINNNSRVIKFRVIDNKIVVILNTSKSDRPGIPINEREVRDNVIVLDEKSKNVLYIGQWKSEEIDYDKMHILKDDEL